MIWYNRKGNLLPERVFVVLTDNSRALRAKTKSVIHTLIGTFWMIIGVRSLISEADSLGFVILTIESVPKRHRVCGSGKIRPSKKSLSCAENKSSSFYESHFISKFFMISRSSANFAKSELSSISKCKLT